MKNQRSTLPPPLSEIELQNMWSRLNGVYFDNRLPPIVIQWSRRLTSSAGLFVSQSGPRTKRLPSAVRHGAGRVIRLSLPLLREQSLAEIRGTLAHEMIHQWQFDLKRCLPSHGREFRRMMTIMNQDGLGIAVYHSLNKEVEAMARYAWECLQCGRSYRRQRRRLSPRTHRCGFCRGELREISPDEKAETRFNVGGIDSRVAQDGNLSHAVQLHLGFMHHKEDIIQRIFST